MKKKLKSGELSKLGNNPLDTIIPSIIIVIFIVLTGIGILGAMFGGVDNIVDEANDIWLKTFVNLEKQRVGVEFNSITTTEDEYTALRMETNKHIEEKDEYNNELNSTLNVDTKISERVYADKVDSGVPKQDTTNIMNETGPIYLENKLILRYINKDGKLKIVAAMYNEDKTKIDILDQENFNTLTQSYKDKTEEEEGKITEKTYLADIELILSKIFTASTSTEFKEAKKMANLYFSVDGKKTVFDGREQLNINEDVEVETLFIEAGKSDQSKITKDRVYVQMKLKSNSYDAILNIVLKMNMYGRIFDVDIL